MAEAQWWSFDRFAGRVGERFTVQESAVDGTDAAPLLLELSEATQSDRPGGSGPDGQLRHQFALVFTGPAERPLPQATLALEHDELGVLELFLVPIGPGRYEAVFG